MEVRGMRIPFVIALLSAAAAAWGTPSKPVDEHFGGGTFPPAGWRSSGSGSGSWSWQNAGGFVRGTVTVPPFGNVETSLVTFAFRVTGGTRVDVRFNYKTDGFTEGRRYVRLGGWSKAVPYTYNHQWTPFADYTAPASSGTYELEFYFTLSGGSHGMSSVWDVDDVEVTLENAAVEASSLGRVKALFR
jgi:hypothetical protein